MIYKEYQTPALNIFGNVMDYNSDPIHGVDIIFHYKSFCDRRACDSLGDFDW